MTIKEAEQRTGMTRANIRYYETEGLLHPRREENGYRDYSEEDIRELEKLKLLRALGVSIEEIRRAKQGSGSLSEILSRRQAELDREEKRLENARRVCDEMRRESVTYQTLDAAKYLTRLEAPQLPGGDALQREFIPWRRLFARLLDMSLCRALLYMLLAAVTDFNLAGTGPLLHVGEILWYLGLSYLLEPVFLSRFGTTPGKWILGLRVRCTDGDWLEPWQVRDRLRRLYSRGLGYGLPGYELYRYWKSYRACEDGEELAWEEDSVVLLNDRKLWRIAAAACALALGIWVVVTACLTQFVPNHRGDLTVAEFAENYNQMLTVNGLGAPRLTTEGAWEEPEGVVVQVEGNPDPELEFTLEDGAVTAVSFREEWDQQGQIVATHRLIRELCLLAFARAQEGWWPYGSETDRLLEKLLAESLETWELETEQIRVTNRVRAEGYASSAGDEFGALFPEENQAQYFSLEFSVARIP